jgi:hypothetical protein
MKSKLLFSLFLFVFCLSQLRAQDEVLTHYDSANSSTISNVIIQQIGEKNSSQLIINATYSNLVINQIGDSNSLYFNKSSPMISQSFEQIGNSNTISDFFSYWNGEIGTQIIQRGNNLNFISLGSNSISKDMIVNQQGNSGLVYIFNH